MPATLYAVVSKLIRIIFDTTQLFDVTFLLRNIIVTSFIIKSRKQVFPLLKRIKCDTIKVLLM